MKSLILLLMLLTNVLSAQNFYTQPKNFIAHSSAHQTMLLSPIPSYKNPNTALWLSIGNTVIPTVSGILINNKSNAWQITKGVLIGYGTMIGPSVGSIYVKDFKRALQGTGIRLVGAGLFSLSVALAFDNLMSDDTDSHKGVGALAVVGIGIYSLGTAWSIVESPTSANEYNTKQNALSLSPSFNPCNKSLGINVHYQF